MSMSNNDNRTPIVLCAGANGRALLFGWVDAYPTKGEEVTLHDARMCLYYPSGGTLGLAASGPPDGSRVTAAVPRTTETVWQEVIETTPAAAERWCDIEAHE
jgi:hypothetical protein